MAYETLSRLVLLTSLIAHLPCLPASPVVCAPVIPVTFRPLFLLCFCHPRAFAHPLPSAGVILPSFPYHLTPSHLADPSSYPSRLPREAFLDWLPRWFSGKNPPASIGDVGSIPGLGRSPGGGNGNPLQYSYLEKSMDRGAWWAAVWRREESDTTEHTRTFWTTVLLSNLPLIICIGLMFFSFRAPSRVMLSFTHYLVKMYLSI